MLAHPSDNLIISEQEKGCKVMEDKNTQTMANKKWQEKNREHTRYLRNRSTARNFIKKQATAGDIQELETLIEIRKKELKNL